jgi:hypothetical protein
MILGAGLMLVGLAAAIPACGGGDEGDDDDGSGSTSGSPSGSGSGNQSSNAASSGESSSSSGQTCDSSFECINDTCQCTTPGAEGTPCCDPEVCGADPANCDAVCEVCA